MIRERDALEYHMRGRAGKLEVVSSKPCATQRDLSLAYTPGVAFPCLRIHRDPAEAAHYTGRGNLVAVVSNGTAVLGLGNIGALAGKPVMEGKAVLFKRFADIDVFDLELATEDPEEIVRAVKLLEPTFGGINLEDIRAPECFVIEETLRREMRIPVFHDDQHGTAIISGAALLNALELVDKRIDEVRVVFNGAGASGIACARYYLSLGVRRENLVLCDSHGVVHRGRAEGMNPYKASLAAETEARSLAQAVAGADVLVGLSVAGAVTADMVRSMARQPIVLAMANPDPEIGYDEILAARPDALAATGRSDYPNQVNNVLGFPFIFRGALDAEACAINEEMKRAATLALAALAKEDVPDSVMKAYGLERLHFGREYVIPKPFDPRVLLHVAPAVAAAAMSSGVAGRTLDLDEYRERLESRLGRSREIMRFVLHRAKRDPKRVVFPEGDDPKVLRATQVVLDERIAEPILLGDEAAIRARAAELDLHLERAQVIAPASDARYARYVEAFHALRRRRGVTRVEAAQRMLERTVFGAMMVREGDAEALVAGVSQHYPETIRPALQIIGKRDDVSRVAGAYLMVLKERVYLFADATVNIEPTAAELADIAILTAELARRFHLEPRVAMISFSNFGSARHPFVDKVREAVDLARRRAPELVIDGEMQADTAVTAELLVEHYPFSRLAEPANVLIFPDLQSANAAYKLVQRLAGAEAIGPLLLGMRRPVHVLQHGTEVKDIVNVVALAVVDAQEQAGEIPAVRRARGIAVEV